MAENVQLLPYLYLSKGPDIYPRGGVGVGTQIAKCIQARVLTPKVEVRGPVESWQPFVCVCVCLWYLCN